MLDDLSFYSNPVNLGNLYLKKLKEKEGDLSELNLDLETLENERLETKLCRQLSDCIIDIQTIGIRQEGADQFTMLFRKLQETITECKFDNLQNKITVINTAIKNISEFVSNLPLIEVEGEIKEKLEEKRVRLIAIVKTLESVKKYLESLV